jgi:hypothetical protein
METNLRNHSEEVADVLLDFTKETAWSGKTLAEST